jgi:SLA1 homology domain 1, SHD1
MRIGRTVLVWSVAVLMVVDSASACRWGCYSGYSSCNSSCYSSCGPSSCYSRTYVSCSPSECPICAAEGSAPVTTNREPTANPPAPPTPQPTFEPTPTPKPAPVVPSPAREPAPFEEPAPEPTLTPPPAFEPPADVTPPTEPAPKPAADVEDLFKDPADAPAAAPAPSAEPPAAPAAPGDNVEDLFKDAAPATPGAPAPMPADKPADAAPADKPGEPSDVEDLFKDIDKKSTSVEPAPTADDVDALFAQPNGSPEPMVSQQETRAIEQEAVKLFGEQPATQPATESAMRQWTDNTGLHHVRARLVEVGSDHVRLLKETGKYTTVPFSRLSQGDLAFVRQQADRAIVANF